MAATQAFSLRIQALPIFLNIQRLLGHVLWYTRVKSARNMCPMYSSIAWIHPLLPWCFNPDSAKCNVGAMSRAPVIPETITSRLVAVCDAVNSSGVSSSSSSAVFEIGPNRSSKLEWTLPIRLLWNICKGWKKLEKHGRKHETRNDSRESIASQEQTVEIIQTRRFTMKAKMITNRFFFFLIFTHNSGPKLWGSCKRPPPSPSRILENEHNDFLVWIFFLLHGRWQAQMMDGRRSGLRCAVLSCAVNNFYFYICCSRACTFHSGFMFLHKKE